MAKQDVSKKIEFDFDSLRSVIRFKFGSLRQFAEEIGLDYPVLLSRLNGHSYFKLDELLLCINKLGLDANEAKRFLFCVKGNRA